MSSDGGTTDTETGATEAPTGTTGTTEAETNAPVQRNKLLAAVFSLLAPGLGQVFVGHTVRGILWAIAAPLFFTFFLFTTQEPSPTSLLKTFVALVLAAYLGSAIDVIILPSTKHRATRSSTIAIFALVAFFAAPIVSVVLRSLVLEAFKIPSGAMIPTLLIGDHLFVDKAVYRKRAPRRGEVMVFKFPERPEQDFIKRIIAAPGDTLLVKDGHPVINGWEVPSCRVGKLQYQDPTDDGGMKHEGELFVEFLEESAYLVFFDTGTVPFNNEAQGPYTAKENDYWVLGDNRHNSHDSRMWFGGTGAGVPRANIKGRARTIWLGVDSSRGGIDLTKDPVAPNADLAAPLVACLSKRPSVKDATPPPPAKPQQ